MPDNVVSFVVDNPVTGVPDAFSLNFGALKDLIIKNAPTVLDAIKGIFSTSGFGPGAGVMPLETKLTDMGMPAELLNPLSPAAKNLTKRDLLSLGGWGGIARKAYDQLNLTPKDVQDIRDLFASKLVPASGATASAWSLSCCSCTPCCCAAAEMEPFHSLA
jgi:hypothetical protein